MSKLFEPIPLRNSDQWKHAQVILASNPKNTVKTQLAHLATITCRDCFGFGHGAKKCPTARKLNLYRKSDKLLRTVISRARTKLANRMVEVNKDATVWFFRTSC